MTAIAAMQTAKKLFTLPRAVLELADFACAEESGRWALQNVLIAFDGSSKGTAVATNGHYLARMVFDVIEAAEPLKGRWLVPAILLADSRGKDSEGVDVFADEIAVIVKGRTGYAKRFPARVIVDGTEAAFPDYEQIIPSPKAYALKGLKRETMPVVGMDFDYVADIARCLSALNKLRGRNKSKCLGASIQFTTDEEGLAPVHFVASGAVLPTGIVSADFILMPVRR